MKPSWSEMKPNESACSTTGLVWRGVLLVFQLSFLPAFTIPIETELVSLERYGIRWRKRRNLRNGELFATAGLRATATHQSTGKTRSSRRKLNALSFHSLRRTATTLLHEAGIAGAVAQALIGHDSEAIHEHYVNVGREALQKAAAVFPSI
jgi:integrase